MKPGETGHSAGISWYVGEKGMNAREKPTKMKSDQNGFSEHFNHSLHFFMLTCAVFSIYSTFSAVLKYFPQMYR